MPQVLAYLWDWFGDYAFGMAGGGMGPAVATWEGLRAWADHMRLTLEPWEARAMIRLGHIRAVVQSEASADKARGDRPGRS